MSRRSLQTANPLPNEVWQRRRRRTKRKVKISLRRLRKRRMIRKMSKPPSKAVSCLKTSRRRRKDSRRKLPGWKDRKRPEGSNFLLKKPKKCQPNRDLNAYKNCLERVSSTLSSCLTK